jgi:hypothetical protein
MYVMVSLQTRHLSKSKFESVSFDFRLIVGHSFLNAKIRGSFQITKIINLYISFYQSYKTDFDNNFAFFKFLND